MGAGGQDGAWQCQVGVELVDTGSGGEQGGHGEPGEADAPAWLEEAAGRHRGRRSRNSVVRRGEQALRAAGRAVSAQVAVMATEIVRGLDGTGLTDPPPGALGLDSVEVGFGITLTAGLGNAVEAVVSAEGEAAVQVTVTLTRRADPPAGAG